jgi:hypothetical protein
VHVSLPNSWFCKINVILANLLWYLLFWIELRFYPKRIEELTVRWISNVEVEAGIRGMKKWHWGGGRLEWGISCEVLKGCLYRPVEVALGLTQPKIPVKNNTKHVLWLHALTVFLISKIILLIGIFVCIRDYNSNGNGLLFDPNTLHDWCMQ